MTVFISHSRQNGSAALKLYERLSQRGVQAWLDLRELDSGEDWNQRVAAADLSPRGFSDPLSRSQALYQGNSTGSLIWRQPACFHLSPFRTNSGFPAPNTSTNQETIRAFPYFANAEAQTVG